MPAIAAVRRWITADGLGWVATSARSPGPRRRMCVGSRGVFASTHRNGEPTGPGSTHSRSGPGVPTPEALEALLDDRVDKVVLRADRRARFHRYRVDRLHPLCSAQQPACTEIMSWVAEGRLQATTSVLVIEGGWRPEHRGRPPLPKGTARMARELFPVLLSVTPVTPQHLQPRWTPSRRVWERPFGWRQRSPSTPAATWS